MKQKFIVLVGGAIIGATLSAMTLLSYDRAASTKEIDEDINLLKITLEEAKTEENLYNGGIIQAQIKLRKSIYESTIAMLERKRQSIIHRINISYAQTGSPLTIAEGKTESISSDIENIKTEVRRAQNEADRYSGGLVLSLILARKAQYEISLASLEQARIAAKYAIPLVTPENVSDPAPAKAKPAEANPTKDKDAL